VEIEGMSSLLGRGIGLRRKQAGLKQQQVADKVGLSLRQYQRYESGEIIPQYDMLETLAGIFGSEFSELIELRDREASDTAEAVAPPPDSTESVAIVLAPELPSDAAEPVVAISNVPGHTGRQTYVTAMLHKRMVYYIGVPVCVVVAVIFVLTHSLWTPSSLTKPVIITGTVLCLNNGPVVNVWYDVLKDGRINKSLSGYANLGITARNGLQMAFAFTLRGDAYILHVGCGGSWQHWKSTYSTETRPGPMYDHKAHFFTCHNAPNASNYGPCDLKY
jgi:transcriptional regulator with XRE-family HTH domain